jgi:dTDP-4-amino-4,6-dideoxygalactose transaminase
MRLHGIDREIWGRYQCGKPAGNSWEYDIVEAGYKYNMSDIAASIGRIQLKKANEMHRKRIRIAEFYLDRLREYDFIRLPRSHEHHAWHLFIIHIDEEKLDIGRDHFIRLLHEKRIGTSVHYIPLHLMSYYKNTYGLKHDDFPIASRQFRTAISLPLYPGLSEEEQNYIVETVIEIGKNHRRVR